MYKLAIFASGTGTNALNIIKHFSSSSSISIDSVWSNNENAPVLNKARNEGIDVFHFSRDEFKDKDGVQAMLKDRGIDLIVLAGFLWLVPDGLVDNFKILNIHPSLLPKYGGKGMYGLAVHEAVIRNKEKESGITIHMVNSEYDSGEIVIQESLLLHDDETPQTLQRRIHELEYRFFPIAIEKILL